MCCFLSACDYRGTVNQTETGNCICKKFVADGTCNECVTGMWNLTLENPDGCQSKCCWQISTLKNTTSAKSNMKYD